MIALVLYIIFCVALARRDAGGIALNIRVNHAHNGTWHLLWWVAGFVTAFFTKEWLPLLAMPFAGRLFFDTALNLMRGLRVGYVSPDAKCRTYVPGSSKVDWREYRIFKSGTTPKIIYAILICSLIILHYVT